MARSVACGDTYAGVAVLHLPYGRAQLSFHFTVGGDRVDKALGSLRQLLTYPHIPPNRTVPKSCDPRQNMQSRDVRRIIAEVEPGPRDEKLTPDRRQPQ